MKPPQTKAEIALSEILPSEGIVIDYVIQGFAARYVERQAVYNAAFRKRLVGLIDLLGSSEGGEVSLVARCWHNATTLVCAPIELRVSPGKATDLGWLSPVPARAQLARTRATAELKLMGDPEQILGVEIGGKKARRIGRSFVWTASIAIPSQPVDLCVWTKSGELFSVRFVIVPVEADARRS